MGCFLCMWRNRSFCERLDGPPHLEAAHTFLITLQRAGYIWSRKFFSWLKSTNSLKAVEQIQRHKAINSCIRSICFCFSACTVWLQYRQEDCLPVYSTNRKKKHLWINQTWNIFNTLLRKMKGRFRKHTLNIYTDIGWVIC